MNRFLRKTRSTLWVTAALTLLSGCGIPEPEIDGAEPSLRRLTEQQYRNIIVDLFGPHIVIAGSFDPLLPRENLIAIGASNATISASSFEKYEKLAYNIAQQVLDERNRDLYMPCEPAGNGAPDDGCARAFLEPVGRLLFRRPLTESELTEAAELSAAATQSLQSFHDGLTFALASLLVSPNFLFVVDDVQAATSETEGVELTPFAKASRLSFFLWNTTPDSALLDAAESGVLDTPKGLAGEIDRLMASPRLHDGVRAFFADMLRLEEFEHLEKDNQIYPAFDPVVVEDAKEQLLRTITHHLLDENADYRDLFTTRETFMNGQLGRVYRVPVAQPSIWTEYEFSGDDGRSGIQTLAGFVALHSHPGRSSPTIRGKAIRELLLCQPVPDPPGDVDFSQFIAASANATARERLKVHNSVASCAGCHKLMDGIGLSLENYDGAGQFRVRDAGIEIDAKGELNGVDYQDTLGFSQALRDDPAIPSCLVERVFAYSAGRSPARADKPWLNFLVDSFADDDYRFRPLMRAIVSSMNFFRVVPPDAGPEAPGADGELLTLDNG